MYINKNMAEPGHGGVKRFTDKRRRVFHRVASKGAAVIAMPRVINMNEKDFERFETCMKGQAQPTEAMQKAINQYQEYKVLLPK